MNEFVYDEENSLYYNWFMLKSLILFPESHKKQRKTFSYLYYRFVLTHREDRNYRLNRVPLKRIANNLNALITQRNFLNSLAERRSTIQAAGIGGRLMFSMAYYNFPEPSVNKVQSLFSYRFNDKKKNFKKLEKEKSFEVDM